MADHSVKFFLSEKRDKYLDLARELKKNMNVAVIPLVIGTFGKISKSLVKGVEDIEIRGQVGTIQSPAFLRSVRILRRVLETYRDLM